MARYRNRRATRTWPQRGLLALNLLLVLACLAAAFGLSKVRATLQSVPVVDVGSSLTEQVNADEPRNILIIGTDAFEGLSSEDPVVNGRNAGQNLADVIMILRVDPRTGTARLLSVPRDSRLELPDGSTQRVNAATMLGNGPKSLVQTIKRNFGISIDNYAQVDFASFEKLVEVLGGVPVYFTTPVRDRTTGLYVDTPGCVRLNPQQALAYARSRHFEFEFMGKWLTDGTGDLGRITRQQDFIKRAIRSASDKGVRNPQTAVGIVDAAVGAVVLDDTLTVDAILGLLSQFRTFNPDDLVTNQVPTESAPRDGVAYQDVVWDQALPLLEPFWGVDPAVGVQPRNVIVDVRSASGDQDRANLVASAFDARGFDAEAYTNRSGSGGVTITYGPAGRDAAVLVARYLDVVPDLKLDESIVGNRVILDVNGQVTGVRDEPKPLEELPEEFQPIPTTTTVPPTTAPVDPSAPETTLPADGAPPDAAPPGVVPTDPERAAACR